MHCKNCERETKYESQEFCSTMCAEEYKYEIEIIDLKDKLKSFKNRVEDQIFQSDLRITLCERQELWKRIQEDFRNILHGGLNE